ncbi:hypothetical protein PTSG_04783 [Salpingoeca rosetta]|uniref:Endonuclease/exonuclease/phosphatase domain-containing protein n=1 Tax=Salpingoeca rosetta (strain ATCC 50818 / BSB-021) TaxID=946362 RepID=F2U9P2_SALR5|nr:uncharacterized protein PTSG_04783 [Salpingoeca rosetta]EGD73069.1 hypothetical protein PTSG_04783 [Salpingoeca rosetta]|eukprot:XP_004994100.1 hypothetical protein PTSG_04783 [Salpingoeca rosetta]
MLKREWVCADDGGTDVGVQEGLKEMPTKQEEGTEEAQDNSIVVCEFNVLANGLAQHGKFSRCDAEYLTWEHRSPLLRDEIARIRADIFGLAECNEFDTFWEPMFAEEGYDVVYCAKSKSPAQRFGGTADGCCIAVRRDRFRVVSKLQRDDAPVAVAAQLLDITTQQHLLVCMCHLKSGRTFGDMRSAQMEMLLASISEFEEGLSRPCPTAIMLGDFNAHSDEMCVTMCEEAGFTKVFSDVKHYPWTTWKYRHGPSADPKDEVEQKHTIDHILARPATRLVSYLALPSDDEVTQGCFPSATFPSDHVSVAVRIAWGPNREGSEDHGDSDQTEAVECVERIEEDHEGDTAGKGTENGAPGATGVTRAGTSAGESERQPQTPNRADDDRSDSH